jgi:hypothetical protein
MFPDIAQKYVGLGIELQMLAAEFMGRSAKIGQEIGRWSGILLIFVVYSIRYNLTKSANMTLIESVQRIEPARLEEPGEAIGDVVAELSATTATLGKALHPRTTANLGALGLPGRLRRNRHIVRLSDLAGDRNEPLCPRASGCARSP